MKEQYSISSPHCILPNKQRKKNNSSVKIPLIRENYKSNTLIRKNKINDKINAKKTRIFSSLFRGYFRNKNENVFIKDFSYNDKSIHYFNSHEDLFDQMFQPNSVKNKNNKCKNECNSAFLNKKSAEKYPLPYQAAGKSGYF